MGVVQNIRDSLTNIMSGKGTTADRAAWSRYAFRPLDQYQVEAAYRTSWLMRKIVDVPALDMTRAWRDWQAEKDAIEAIEAEEKRIQLKAKCKRALILARLYGGSAIFMGTNDADVSQPVKPAAVGKDGLTYLHVFSRWQLTLGPRRLDPADEWFGKPEYYMINVDPKEVGVQIHPSRMVEFIGQQNPEGSYLTGTQPGSWLWGDPIMQSIESAVKNAEMAQDGFAALIDKASIDVLQIPDLTSRAGHPDYEAQLTKRLAAASQGMSTWRMLAIDAAEKWDKLQVSWGGAPAMMAEFMLTVAGAADIPMTRLLGQSPKGLQSTGDGEERDYQSMIKARQDEQLVPALDRIDALLLPSALGTVPSDIYYEMGPLQELSEKDAGLVEYQLSQTVAEYAATGLIPDQALSAIAKNRIIESGRWPGAEAAFEEFTELNAPQGENEPEPVNTDPHQLQTLEQRIAAMEKKGTVSKDHALRLLTDAAPQTLYVQRKLLNAKAVIAWAKSQGFETTLGADEMHVTVVYSKEPVDWMSFGQAWGEDQNGHVRIPPGGARMLDLFGGLKDAVVLLFNSSDLAWRHQSMIQAGASSDYDNYQPHVTITYSAPADLDLSKIEPYRGELIFGPEIFENTNDDWKSAIEEE